MSARAAQTRVLDRRDPEQVRRRLHEAQVQARRKECESAGEGRLLSDGGLPAPAVDDPRRISAADRKQQHRPHEVPPDYYLIPGQPVTATHAFWGLPTQECWELAEEAEQEARWRAVSAAAPTDITINDCKLAHAAPATAGRRCMRRLSERRLSSGGIQPLQSSGGQR